MLSENALRWKRFAGVAFDVRPSPKAWCIHLAVSFLVFEKTRAHISHRPRLPAAKLVNEAQLSLKPLANAVR